MLRTNRETKCHGQKLVFSLVKARFDESTIVQVLRSPPVLHDSRAYVNLISRGLWDTYLNPKGFRLKCSSEIVRYVLEQWTRMPFLGNTRLHVMNTLSLCKNKALENWWCWLEGAPPLTRAVLSPWLFSSVRFQVLLQLCVICDVFKKWPGLFWRVRGGWGYSWIGRQVGVNKK